MQSFEFLGRPTTAKKATKNHQAIEQNLQKITPYLDSDDIVALKLTCRAFYYYYVTAELWVGLKLNVAEQKLQYFDDFEFEESEAKQITKKDKNIRIHSLKKQNEQRMKKGPAREASNIKQKAKAINVNNELLFRNTEIGFKRLLKGTSKKKIADLGYDYEVKEAGDLPKLGEIGMYLIKISDPWSTNMGKAQNLINLFKKINQFHHKFLVDLKLQSKDMGSLVAKLKRSQEKSKFYTEVTSSQPYLTVISSTEGSKQNLLIDDQLNKVCRLFWTYHSPMQKIHPQCQSFIQLLEKEKLRIEGALTQNVGVKFSVKFIQDLSNVDESVQLCQGFLEGNRELGQILAPQLIGIYFGVIQYFEELSLKFEDTGEQTKISIISWGPISRKPFFSQTLFQILLSLSTRLLKLSQSLSPQDITLSITVNKLKSIKSVSQSLLNISKYFSKIRKQIEEKERKGKDARTPDSIRQFLGFYQGRDEQGLYLTRNLGKLEKIIGEFKERIAALKTKIQSN